MLDIPYTRVVLSSENNQLQLTISSMHEQIIASSKGVSLDSRNGFWFRFDRIDDLLVSYIVNITIQYRIKTHVRVPFFSCPHSTHKQSNFSTITCNIRQVYALNVDFHDFPNCFNLSVKYMHQEIHIEVTNFYIFFWFNFKTFAFQLLHFFKSVCVTQIVDNTV